MQTDFKFLKNNRAKSFILFPHSQTWHRRNQIYFSPCHTAMKNKEFKVSCFICAISANSTLENEEIMRRLQKLLYWCTSHYLYYSIAYIHLHHSFLWCHKGYSHQRIQIIWLYSHCLMTKNDEDAGDVIEIMKWTDNIGLMNNIETLVRNWNISLFSSY